MCECANASMDDGVVLGIQTETEANATCTCAAHVLQTRAQTYARHAWAGKARLIKYRRVARVRNRESRASRGSIACVCDSRNIAQEIY